MMSTIKSGVIGVTMGDGAVQHLYVRGGFADVSPSGLTILAEQAVALDEVDISSIEQDIVDARINKECRNERKENDAGIYSLNAFEGEIDSVFLAQFLPVRAPSVSAFSKQNIVAFLSKSEK